MENFRYLYKSDAAKDTSNLEPLKYFEIKKIIKKDFERLSYVYEEYENNTELMYEIKNVIENICSNEEIEIHSQILISLSSEYLYFNYINHGSSDYDYNTVVVTRDFKEFYFFKQNNFDFKIAIKKFKINENKIQYAKYEGAMLFDLFKNDDSIHKSINKLKRLQSVNS